MNYKLKAEIHEAIQKVLDKNAENNMWGHFIEDRCIDKMTDAAALVFDSSMDGQAFYQKEINS